MFPSQPTLVEGIMFLSPGGCLCPCNRHFRSLGRMEKDLSCSLPLTVESSLFSTMFPTQAPCVQGHCSAVSSHIHPHMYFSFSSVTQKDGGKYSEARVGSASSQLFPSNPGLWFRSDSRIHFFDCLELGREGFLTSTLKPWQYSATCQVLCVFG